ncbi:hypothetical protein MTBSS4_50020 [Magnetospirillum sp. SS-4]|nr:hypothetical protein MTBSS4_50020 [Magnetospirillum sp. SS-4]
MSQTCLAKERGKGIVTRKIEAEKPTTYRERQGSARPAAHDAWSSPPHGGPEPGRPRRRDCPGRDATPMKHRRNHAFDHWNS